MEWIFGTAAFGAIVAAVALALSWQKAKTTMEAQKRELDAKVRELEARRQELDEAISVGNERGARCQVLEAENARSKLQIDELRGERDSARQAGDIAAKEHAKLQADHATLRETLDQERKQSLEKLALLSEAKEQMKLEFKALADEVMKGHSTTFTKQNKDQIQTLLNPLQERIGHFQQALHNAHVESNKERITLAEQIRSLTTMSTDMLSETSNLTRALKGDTQTQGAWGEMILEGILERSGLREGEEYSSQESHTFDGSRVRTDVIVKLPNGQRVIIDSKVSLTAFDSFVRAESDEERARHLKAHLTSLKTHIKTLSGKDYHAAAGSDLGYVILFVPIEGALAAALQEDSAITAYAVDNNVPIATPTTLMIALRTIANLWQVERRNRNAEEIAKRAGRLYEKFVGFVGNMQKLGTQLDRAKESYDSSMSQLSIGPGNIVRQVEQLKTMGAKTTKTLPDNLIAEFGADAEYSGEDVTDTLRLITTENETAAE